MKSKATRIFIIIKLAVLVSIVAFIYLKLEERNDLIRKSVDAMINVSYSQNDTIAYAIILMPLNWFLEALKWRYLSRSVTKLSHIQALKGVFSGLVLSFITPHGLGDYMGRIGLLNKKNRGRLVGAVFVGRVGQMMATVTFGIIGVAMLFGTYGVLPMLIISLTGALLFVGFRKAWGSKRVKSSIFQKLKPYMHIITEFSTKELINVLWYSMVRYLVFSLQFFLILDLFLPETGRMLKFGGITWIFLAKSILPTFNFLSDLGVREISAVYFFEHFHRPPEPVVAASLMIWLVNILVPTVFSLPLVLYLKLKPE